MKKKTVSAKLERPGTNKTSIGRQEKDVDDLVHDEANEPASGPDEEDADDRVHRVKKPGVSQIQEANPGMEDPDDLVHGYPEKDED
jgi:hypothetical protein